MDFPLFPSGNIRETVAVDALIFCRTKGGSSAKSGFFRSRTEHDVVARGFVGSLEVLVVYGRCFEGSRDGTGGISGAFHSCFFVGGEISGEDGDKMTTWWEI